MLFNQITCYKEYISYVFQDFKICYFYYKLKCNNGTLEDEI